MLSVLTDEEFYSIYSKVPRLNVDVVVKSPAGILLALRSIEPHRDMWHIPGGTVYKGETIEEATKRIAKNETNLDVKFTKCLGYVEFLDEKREGNSMHTIGIVLEAEPIGGKAKPDENSSELRYFKEIPENIVSEHYDFFKNNEEKFPFNNS